MNHPTPDQWMAFLYGEATETERDDLGAHLRACPECAAKVKTWRVGMNALDEWKLPQGTPARRQPALRWAAAAAVLVLGVVLGRFSMAREMDNRLAALRTEVRQAAAESAGAETLRLLTDYAEALDEKRGAEAATFLSALKQLDARRGTEIDRLRHDLGTVAVYADARLSETQEQLYQLANDTLPPERVPADDQ